MTRSRDDFEQTRLDRLVEAGMLSRAEAAHATALKAGSREPLDIVLTRAGLVSESRIAAFFASETGLEHAESIDEIRGLDTALDLTDFNPDFLVAERVMPLGLRNEACVVGLVDPANRAAVEGVRFVGGRSVESVVVTQSLFSALCADRLRSEAGADDDEADGMLDVSLDAERLRDLASAGPVVRRLDGLIARATEARASDIHIELRHREAQIRLRVDGVLKDHAAWPTSQALAVISRVKVLAELDIAERRRPQDGRFSMPVAGRTIDLRVSVVPGQYGESLVLRLLDPEASLRGIENLGLSAAVSEPIEAMLSMPHGLILVTGPTGSGKTTSLYAFLRRLANGERKILTIEDPIEYRLPGVAQSQTNPAIDLTFANALRAFLRHDPDVVMVGEIRDAETARTAIQAAMTGHLVLSTLHTNDAPSAISRLRDMGVEDFLLAATLVGVVGQRLVRRTCEKCGGARCNHCDETGFRGRMPVAEAFRVNDNVRASIRDGGREAGLIPVLARAGYKTMWQDGLALCEKGLTTRDELMRALEDTGQADPEQSIV
ncbi:GspE/PulE family protein [Maricaulis maris]|uniref:General secretion pathway protein E n=1 Tax=Maricaulis maris TaxID=74318 RepID=A0A495D025_9PROT|nr:GspE/PulE family protein [Maricaulis maris]RKQ94129.1 general secretion pathway protein E [Maricaulis maris]